MAELFDEIVAVLESRPAAAAMANLTRVANAPSSENGAAVAANAAVLGAPLIIAKLADSLYDSNTSPLLLRAIRTVNSVRLQDPGAAIETGAHDPIGTQTADVLLGAQLPAAARSIATETGLNTAQVSSLIPISAWAVTASIADRYGSRIDRQTLTSILESERSDLVASGWGPWIDTVAHQAPAATMTGQLSKIDLLPKPRSAEYPPPLDRSAREQGGLPLNSIDSARPLDKATTATGLASATNGKSASQIHTRPATSANNRPTSPGVSSPANPSDDYNVAIRSSRDESNSRGGFFALLGIAAIALIGLGAVIWFLSQGPSTEATDDPPTSGASNDEDGAASLGSGTEESSATTNAATDGQPSGALPADAQLAYQIEMDDPLQRADATGVAALQFNPDAGELCYNVTTEGLGAPYDAHIHVGPPGVKGGIVVDFSPLTDGEERCVDVAATDMEAILTFPAAHYVEMHDPSGDFTIRAQLSDGPLPEPESDEDLTFDPLGGGATTTISSGQILLEGEVADQATADRLVAEVSGLDESRILVVNDLEIVEGAPPPTGLISVDAEVLFDVDSTDLSEGNTIIEDLALLFNARPSWSMLIIGYTDNSGTDVYNLELSLGRADAVRAALVESGINTTRLRIEGAGSNDPIGDNSTPEGRAENRRIEFDIFRD